MSDDEIREVLGGNASIITVQLARHVREMRQLERMSQPHWSVLDVLVWRRFIGHRRDCVDDLSTWRCKIADKQATLDRDSAAAIRRTLRLILDS